MNEVYVTIPLSTDTVFVTTFDVVVGIESHDARNYAGMMGSAARVRVHRVDPAIDGLYACVQAVADGSLITFTFSKVTA